MTPHRWLHSSSSSLVVTSETTHRRFDYQYITILYIFFTHLTDFKDFTIVFGLIFSSASVSVFVVLAAYSDRFGRFSHVSEIVAHPSVSLYSLTKAKGIEKPVIARSQEDERCTNLISSGQIQQGRVQCQQRCCLSASWSVCSGSCENL